MSCVHFKFFSRLSGDKAIFNGLCISLADLKKKIMAQMRLKAEHCELQITDALTQQEYTDEATLIPKNSSVIVRRIPIGGLKNTTKTFFLHRNEQESGTLKAIGRSQNQVGHSFHNYSAQGASKPIKPTDDTSLISLIQLAETANLADANAPEEDKIKAMMLQSACVHNPDKNIKTLLESARLNDSCFGCFLPGHYVKDCPTKEEKSLKSANKIKKSTGIPCSFMIEVTDPNTKGAMLTNSGKYAVPIISAKAYAKGKRENPPFLPGDQSPSPEEKEPIPDMLLCMICKNIMTDAAVIPCCGNSYCDECIRNSLLESEEHACPTCHKTGVSPDNIISNKGLREFINNSRRVCTKEVSKQRQLQATDPPSAVPVPSHNKENLMPALFKKLTNSSYGRRYSAPVTSANNLLLPDSLLMRSQGFRAPLLPLMHPLPDDWLPPGLNLHTADHLILKMQAHTPNSKHQNLVTVLEPSDDLILDLYQDPLHSRGSPTEEGMLAAPDPVLTGALAPDPSLHPANTKLDLDPLHIGTLIIGTPMTIVFLHQTEPQWWLCLELLVDWRNQHLCWFYFTLIQLVTKLII
ncbi:E3 ubiquitin-protein ligase RBBP6-like isoform X2 [Hyperolius riggenbachi]|uniref:E3 ubiquitin-protein ligase RBBP6-like isoform X2 n=1 Tax=Hyperolius riggenbachi TaxID=752182 RepID=UPI0035A3CD9B